MHEAREQRVKLTIYHSERLLVSHTLGGNSDATTVRNLTATGFSPGSSPSTTLARSLN